MSEEIKTEVAPEPVPFDKDAAQKEFERVLAMGAMLVTPLIQPFAKKQPLILTLREGLRVGNVSFGVPVFKFYGTGVKEIEVLFECVGPTQDQCTVLVLASEDGHDKPKYRISCKVADLRAYPLEEPKATEPTFVPKPRVVGPSNNPAMPEAKS